MDAEGGRVVHREWRARKLAVVVAVQNLLVAACLVVTFYVYQGVQERASGDNIHIQFGAISSISVNETLRFNHTHSMNMMSLADKQNDKIYVNCTGPYIVHIEVCYKSLAGKNATGKLELQVKEILVSSFDLRTSEDDCSRLHSIAYLKAKDQASLHFYANDGFKIKELTMGLSYLLGGRCFF